MSRYTNVSHRYFKKSEKYKPSSQHPDVKPEDRGADGPWLTGHIESPLAVRYSQPALIEID